MARFLKIPLFFLFIASLIGVFLRWQFIQSFPGVSYSNFLHAHSHVMFLGWVFNVLYLGFVITHIESSQQRVFRNLFLIMQFLVVGMLISFPLQGYAVFSITFSTLHTLASFVYIFLYFRHTNSKKSVSLWFSRAALVFFALSSAGPFALAYLMSGNPGHSHWYQFSIYYYLHFQYNGFFFFGILSLFCQLLEHGENTGLLSSVQSLGKVFFVVTIPAYFLSTLWAKPGLAFNITGGLSAACQLYLFYQLIRWAIDNKTEIRNVFGDSTRYLKLIMILLGLKFVLQQLSAFPYFAQLSYELRPVLIAYLHLMLLGVITLFLLVWYRISGHLKTNSTITFNTLVLSFAAMELILIASAWFTDEITCSNITPSHYLLILSVLLCACCLSFLLQFNKGDESQVLN